MDIRTLNGDRIIENAWCLAQVAKIKPEFALDIGCGNSDLTGKMADYCGTLIAIDLQRVSQPEK